MNMLPIDRALSILSMVPSPTAPSRKVYESDCLNIL